MRGNDKTMTVRERFDNYLLQNKKRRTAERFEILEKVLTMPGHFSAEELGEILRKNGFPISNATIYATLDLLVECGIIVRQRFANKACLYEKASASVSGTHHHLICVSCGKIKEVRDPSFSKQIGERRFPNFFQNYYTLNIYGTCSGCMRKRKKNQKDQTKQ